jgi:hypothetical protein
MIEQEKQQKLTSFYFKIEEIKISIDNLENVSINGCLNITLASEILMLYLKTLRMDYKVMFNSNLPIIENRDITSNIPKGLTYENLVKNIINDLFSITMEYDYVTPLYNCIFYLDEEILTKFEEFL